MPKKSEQPERIIPDKHKAIREEQPKIQKGIDNLVESYMKSEDRVNFQRRYARRNLPKKK